MRNQNSPRQQCRLLLAALAVAFFWSSNTSLAQISHGGQPVDWKSKVASVPQWKTFEALDTKQLATEDAATAQFKDAPWRFGIEHDVEWDAAHEGTWSIEGDKRVWRLGIRGEKTLSWSFFFSAFDLPVGGELFVWNENRSDFIGSFTSANEKPWGGLAIGVLEGSGVVIEYTQPIELQSMPHLVIDQAVQGYRSLLSRSIPPQAKSNNQGPFGNSGSCNINVNCPEGADWQIEKAAVALIVNGGFATCSGSMINNTSNDGTPYFLTANHCLGNPNTWTYYFNHESATCAGSTGPTSMSISGGNLLVANGASDVALIELSDEPPASWNVEYAGWDATGSTPENATGIHHPSGDVKKICFEEDSPYPSTASGAQVWWIDQWEDGVTEGGSSGSPLFDQNHRIIGQLYGGAAACQGSVNNGLFDYYGRMDVSWGLGLNTYLDPTNTGLLVLDGYPSGFNSDLGCTDPDACNYDADAIEDNGSCTYAPEGFPCDCSTDVEFAVANLIGGAGETMTLDGATGGALGLLSIDLDYSEATSGSWAGDFLLGICDPGGTCVEIGGYNLTIGYTNAGDWPVSWNVGDAGNYTASIDLTLYDLSGDGTWTLEFYNGYNSAATATWAGTITLDGLCAGDAAVSGCTDSNACNFDADATEDDGSCVFVSGCDFCVIAANGDVTVVDGDTDEDGVCNDDEVVGCQDDTACNYDALATDPGSCEYAADGFDCDGNALGCPEDLNGNGTVEVSDVLLLLSEFGCMTDCSVADINGDGAVSVGDVLLLLAAFGEEC